LSESEINRLKEDLRITINELSKTYEELSLLYRLTENFSGATVDELCDVLIDEIQSQLNVNTIAVLLYNQTLKQLYTKKAVGRWQDDDKGIGKIKLFRDMLTRGKATTICDVTSIDEMRSLGFRSVLLAPLMGKKNPVGLIVVADKTDENEFFSGDVKLLSTISSFAGLFIENALLAEEIQAFFIGSIRSFVKALEARSMWTAGHTERVTKYAIEIGMELGLSRMEMEKLRICSLLHDIGKIAIPDQLLNKMGALNEIEWAELKRHPVIGAEILSELVGFVDIIDCIRCHHEHYDGTGLIGLKGEEIPLTARIIAVADAFDAITFDRPYREKKTVDYAVKEIIQNSGTQFDPKVVDAFLRWIESADHIVMSDTKTSP